ncbi:MAG TPA: HAD family acid phosphatase [Mycobacteriales bacterium]|jgi:predicted secreted acid phosphatase|nr:HAD family acid phosphatase [Mycobacteriales bacterium]
MMRIKVLAVALAVLVFTGCGSTASRPSTAALPNYEGWQNAVKRATNPAIPWLQQRIAKGGAKLAVVLDIDNTSLETHYHPGAPNKPVLAVANWAHEHQVSVLFVTLRGEANRENTTDQLTKAGYRVDALCMKTTGKGTKPRCRQKLTDDGYTITANIGNRGTDMRGGNYEKKFQLPDYNGALA